MMNNTIDYKSVTHKTLSTVLECGLCKAIYTILQAKGACIREELVDYLNLPPTTVYDHLRPLMIEGLVEAKKLRVSRRGRSMTLFVAKEKKDGKFKLTDIQTEVVTNVNKYDLYINLWGKMTGKTSAATLAALVSKEPVLYISKTKKLQKKAMYLNFRHWVDTIGKEYHGCGIVKFTNQKEYFLQFTQFKEQYEGPITVIIDELYPNTKIIDTLILEENIHIVAFITPEIIYDNEQMTKTLLKDIEKLFHGFYDFNRTIFMDTTYCPTHHFIEKWKKTDAEYSIDTQTLMGIESIMPIERFQVEFLCNLEYILSEGEEHEYERF